MNNSLAQTLPFWHFDNNLMVYSDGSFGAGFLLKGFDGNFLDNQEKNNFSSQIENLLITAKEGLKLQIFYNLSPRINHLIKEHKELQNNSLEHYKPIKEARINFLEEKNKAFFMPEIYFFIRSKSINYTKQKFWQTNKKFETISLEEYRKHKAKFLLNVRQIKSSLALCSLSPKILKRNEWCKLLFDYLNPERAERIDFPSFQEKEGIFSSSLSDKLTLTDLSIYPDHIRLGSKFLRVVSLKALPNSYTQIGMIQSLLSLPFHFLLSQNIRILNQTKERERLELKRRVAHSFVGGGSVNDLDAENKLDNIEDLLRELIGGTQRLVSMDFNTIIWADSKNELEEKTDEVLKALRNLNQAEGISETLASFDAYISAIPGNCEGLRHKKMKTTNCAHLLPLFQSWEGSSKAVSLFPTREGSLFKFNPFSQELPNWNGLCFGGSGSGKSFTLIQLLLQFYGQTPMPKLFWIDNGRSSERMTKILGGEFIDIKLDSQVSINMFDLRKNETKPSSSKIKLILAVLEVILKDENKKSLGKRKKALLEEAIIQTYEKTKRIPILSDLRRILKNHKDQEMQKFSQILYPWTENRAYGKLLDRATNINFSKNPIAVEVEGLINHPELKDVFLLLITSYVEEMARADLSTPYLLICDEAERFFHSGELAKEFIVTCFRTWRKLNAGIWCASQNYRDFMSDSQIRDALLPNSSSLIILQQNKIDWEDFKKTFDWNSAQIQAIQNLEIKKRKYSEIFLSQNNRQTILKLISEPLSYWIATSDGKEKARIIDMKKKYPNLSKIEILKKITFQK